MSKSRQLSDAINSVDISESAPADAVTLDASGNLLVGKTASGTQSTVDGIELREAGFLFVTKSNDAPAYFHRRSSDGDIAQFRKDGTTVGSIGVADSGDRIYLSGGGLEGVGIDNGANAFVPTSQVGAYKDGHLALGRSDARFTNLYLSGGVYLGGTGSANKLDDYEEGTWTVVNRSIASLTIANNTQARYVKIGGLVFIHFYITYPVTSDTNTAKINLPFVATGYGMITGRFQGAALSGTTGFVMQTGDGTDETNFQPITSSAAPFNNAQVSGRYLLLSGCYQTTA